MNGYGETSVFAPETSFGVDAPWPVREDLFAGETDPQGLTGPPPGSASEPEAQPASGDESGSVPGYDKTRYETGYAELGHTTSGAGWGYELADGAPAGSPHEHASVSELEAHWEHAGLQDGLGEHTTYEDTTYEDTTYGQEAYPFEAFGPEALSTLEVLLSAEGLLPPGAFESVKGASALALGPDLRRGSSGPAVSQLQQSLNRLGHSLVVDGRFGVRTDAAVRAFQGSRGLAVDGIVGPRTKAALAHALQQPGPSPAPPVGTAYQVQVDAGRNGLLVGGPHAWSFGATGAGAAVLVNNDDDGANGSPDNEDPTVDSGSDGNELSPLVLVRLGAALAAGTTLDLTVSDPKRLRVFQSRAPGSPELIGPARGPSHRFVAPAPRIELAMEGIRYAGGGSNGEVTLTATTTTPGAPPTSSTTVVRLAPWIISNHLDRAEKVFVADIGAENQRFRNELRRLVTAAGCTLVEVAAPAQDRWIQDCMEFGYAHVPPTVLRTVFRAPRPRALQTVARALLRDGLGFVAVGTPHPLSSEDSTGNLEATPPTSSSAGKQYPVGRIYFSPGTASQPFDPEVRDFLRRQVVQEPIEVDLTWLTVGHVDEVISIVPAPTPRGWKLVLASPRLAYQILDAAVTTDPAARMLIGRRLPKDDGTDTSVEMTVRDFLALQDDFHPDLRSFNPTYAARSLRSYNQDRDRDMAAVRRTMSPALGLTDDDIVELPMTFMPNPATPAVADAFTGAVVNMLVVNGHCIVPKAFGPVVAGTDRFEQDVRTKLTAVGATASFIDNWFEYHVQLGSVHCGTNTLRAAKPSRWWEFTP